MSCSFVLQLNLLNKQLLYANLSSFATLSWSTVGLVVSLFVFRVKRNSLIEGMGLDHIMCLLFIIHMESNFAINAS